MMPSIEFLCISESCSLVAALVSEIPVPLVSEGVCAKSFVCCTEPTSSTIFVAGLISVRRAKMGARVGQTIKTPIAPVTETNLQKISGRVYGRSP